MARCAALTSTAAAIKATIGLALLVCCTFARAASFVSVRSGPWSDPIWGTTPTTKDRGNANRVPGEGDDVVIASGTSVIFDASSADVLNRITVQSQAVLTCPRNTNLNATTSNLALSVATLRVESGGCFSCGYGDCSSDAEPFAGKFVLRLTSSTPPSSTQEDVRTLMVESGGSLFLSGAPRVRAIARLAADVESGQATLRIADADIIGGNDAASYQQQPWRVGDRVVVAPTDSIPSQSEYGTIVGLETSGSGATMTLSDPLKYTRNGRILSLVNKPDNNRQVTVDTRAEVALLSRNVVIEGTNDAVTGLGGDLMMAGDNVRARLSWVELRYLGRRGHLARYPLHIHNLGDSGKNVYVSNVAIHSSFQRGIVIHCSNGVTLINNTVAGSPGFAYMLEDGAEENNTLVGNYAIDVEPANYPLIQTERVNSAGFWFVNAANTFVGNVAAGVAGVGFSLDMDPVLGARPSTLSTCPERLPGYNATLARNSNDATEFNRAVNTALIKKNFVRFQDNVVHAAHSGLWMSYPFTPMFFVERPVPIVRFTAWNIAARQMPSSLLDSSDGVSLQFDGCIRLQGQRGMHIYQPTCVNADSATWASCVSTFDGLTVAWVGDEVLKPGGGRARFSQPTASAASSGGAMFTHLEPQIFLRTQIIEEAPALVERSAMASPSPPQLPLLFASVSKGGPLATLNTLSGTAVDDDRTLSAASDPALIKLNAGDMHVFTDVVGDAFGSGPGATVAATYFNASGVDPLIEAYAPGQCRTGTYASNRKWPHVSSSLLPNVRAIAVRGGLPMLCVPVSSSSSSSPLSPSSGLPALRFVSFNVDLRGANWAKAAQVPVADMKAAFAISRASQPAQRLVDMFPVLLPLNEASRDPQFGGYLVSFAPETWIRGAKVVADAPAAEQMEIALGSTIQESDGMTVVLTGLPVQARVSKRQPSGPRVVVENGTTLAACRDVVSACASAASKRINGGSMACVCTAPEVLGGGSGTTALAAVVRFQAGPPARSVGLFTSQGKNASVFDFPALRFELA